MYAIEVLKKEKALIDECLSRGNWAEYTEALKRQSKKSKELEKAIPILKTKTLNTI